MRLAEIPYWNTRERSERAMMHCRYVAATGLIAALLVSASVRADDSMSRKEITNALTQWTAAFNAGDAEKTCALFSRELRADYRGLPERGYAGQCDILKRSLDDTTRRYSYALAIKEILVWNDVAVVRLTWMLTITPKEGKPITSIEPGLDVFRKEADGRWRIVRYMAYEQ
jgi:steroid delta-isomerase